MDILLNPAQARVLGSLVEKDITTPEYYPLSLNALVNACNQKSNREPVMSLSEDAVRDALAGLQEYRLAGPASNADSRVPKYEHRLQEVFNFDRREIALLCVLLLRGPQTPGELRGRTERMYHFDSLDDVQGGLQCRGKENSQPCARKSPLSVRRSLTSNPSSPRSGNNSNSFSFVSRVTLLRNLRVRSLPPPRRKNLSGRFLRGWRSSCHFPNIFRRASGQNSFTTLKNVSSANCCPHLLAVFPHDRSAAG